MKPRPHKIRQLTANQQVIYGWHAARHALLNPRRRIHAVYATPSVLAKLEADLATALPSIPNIYSVAAGELAALAGGMAGGIAGGNKPANTPKNTPNNTPSNTQGIVVVADKLASPSLSEWLAAHNTRDQPNQSGQTLRVVLGDQLHDSRNIGAIVRSLWAFGEAGGSGFITTHRHAPPITSAMLKAASGGGEYVSVMGVANLTQAIALLQREGFFVVGLDAGGRGDVTGLAGVARLALVVGSEGKGLRRLTRARVDGLVAIDIAGEAESLNASVAVAIALFVARSDLAAGGVGSGAAGGAAGG